MKFIKSLKFLKPIIRKLKIGSFEFRLNMNSLKRMQYAYICFHAAKLGKQLGYKKISVVEYGVAGGQGLLILEEHIKEIEKFFNIEIDIYGFDTGEGLPEPIDYRDLPYHWKKGFFQMSKLNLENKLKKSKLVIGNINNTSKDFFTNFNPAPIGAVMHDFDFYSSTKTALSMMCKNEKFFLPRVFSYFDDTIGDDLSLYNDFTGERLAINEFNNENNDIKICIPYHFKAVNSETWHHQIWISHFFKHEKYNNFISNDNQQLNI
jgi:hypothetical protein